MVSISKIFLGVLCAINDLEATRLVAVAERENKKLRATVIDGVELKKNPFLLLGETIWC